MKSKQPDKQIHVTFDSSTIIRILLLVFGAMLVMIFLSNIIQPLILIIVSFFLAVALNPPVSWIARHLKSKSRVRATAAAYVVVIGILVAFFSIAFPPLVSQTVDFLKEVPEKVQNINNQDSTLGSFIVRYELQDEVSKFSSDLKSRFSDLGEPALATAGKIGSTVINTLMVLVLTFMMLVEGPMWLQKYFAALSPKSRNHQMKLAKKMYKVIVGFVNGQVIIAALGGVFATLALFIASQVLDVTINPIALGGIVALFALLPYVGTIAGAILVILACLLVSFPLAAVMAIYFVIYQQIENISIQPYIQSKTNTLTPMLVLISALLGIGLGGLLGAILAIPAGGCIKVLADDYFERREIRRGTSASA